MIINKAQPRFLTQTNVNPYTDLQGLTKKGPRGLLRKSFKDCVMLHLLTLFPTSAAEQERYYIMNVLKKPQHVSIHQFVQRVEQLNTSRNCHAGTTGQA